VGCIFGYFFLNVSFIICPLNPASQICSEFSYVLGLYTGMSFTLKAETKHFRCYKKVEPNRIIFLRMLDILLCGISVNHNLLFSIIDVYWNVTMLYVSVVYIIRRFIKNNVSLFINDLLASFITIYIHIIIKRKKKILTYYILSIPPYPIL
jgi:hypothetical protein